MQKIFFVSVLVLTVAASAAIQLAHAQQIGGGVDVDGEWWLGEGLKQGDLFSYKVCHIGHHECTPFEVDFWIQGETQVGSETNWLVQAVAYDGEKVYKGDMRFGKTTFEPTGGSENLVSYRTAMKSSIFWLSSFATSYGGEGGEGPKQFRAPSWGKIANIGGEQVRPLAVEHVSVPAGEFDAVKIGWRTGGYHSNVWVVDEFPFPVKASTLTHVASGIPPPEYEFILLKYQEDVQHDPFADIVSSAEEEAVLGCPNNEKLQLNFIKKSTTNFAYGLEIGHKPEEPKQGCPIDWLIKFKSKYNEAEFLNQVHYDILVVDPEADGEILRSMATEENREFLYSPSGLTERTMLVREPAGVNHFAIIVYGLAPEFVVPDPAKTPVDYLIFPLTIQANDLIHGGDPNQDDTVEPVLPGDGGSSQIPAWVKNNAGLWSDGVIDDDTFVAGIQYLIQERVIVIPETERDAGSDGSSQIPAWVKNNAGLWSDGVIDDDTFVAGIQYMIENGIIMIS